MAEWAVFYSEDAAQPYYTGPVEETPVADVLAIVQGSKSVGWYTQAGGDFYVWEKDRWWACDKFGLTTYLMRPGWKRVLIGRMVSREEYNRVFNAVLKMREFGNKSGYLPPQWEPRPND